MGKWVPVIEDRQRRWDARIESYRNKVTQREWGKCLLRVCMGGGRGGVGARAHGAILGGFKVVH